MKQVKFVQDTRHYKSGDTVDVTDENRDHLVRCVGRGWAVDVDSEDDGKTPHDPKAEEVALTEAGITAPEDLKEEEGKSDGD